MTDTLNELFGSPIRTKLLKLFLMSPDSNFSHAEIFRQTRMPAVRYRGELKHLQNVGLVLAGKSKLAVTLPAHQGKRIKFVPTEIFSINKEFPLFSELRNLVLKSAPHAKTQLSNKVRRLGDVKLAVLAGVFIDNPNSRADILIVGDGIGKSKMKSFIQWLETEVGKELNYVAMSSQEFKYRMDMYDRFVRDILELPHETIINKLGV